MAGRTTNASAPVGDWAHMDATAKGTMMLAAKRGDGRYDDEELSMFARECSSERGESRKLKMRRAVTR